MLTNSGNAGFGGRCSPRPSTAGAGLTHVGMTDVESRGAWRRKDGSPMTDVGDDGVGIAMSEF